MAVMKGFSRIPIIDGSRDKIVGIAHVRELIQIALQGGGDRLVHSVLRPPLFVSREEMIHRVLREMQARKAHMAIVLDEFGGVDGLVTLEDILEELVGEIWDDDDGIGTDEIEVEVITASEAVDFADSLIQDLPEFCFKGQADNRKNALSNKFNEVKNALDAGDIRDAINKLMNDIRAKADGSVDGKSSNDWITDEEAQERLCLVIDELVKYLESLQDG